MGKAGCTRHGEDGDRLPCFLFTVSVPTIVVCCYYPSRYSARYRPIRESRSSIVAVVTGTHLNGGGQGSDQALGGGQAL